MPTLKNVLELPTDEQMLTCNGNVCTKAAQGEYDTENTYTFDTSGETPVLVQVIEIETPLIPEEVVAQWRRGPKANEPASSPPSARRAKRSECTSRSNV